MVEFLGPSYFHISLSFHISPFVWKTLEANAVEAEEKGLDNGHDQEIDGELKAGNENHLKLVLNAVFRLLFAFQTKWSGGGSMYSIPPHGSSRTISFDGVCPSRSISMPGPGSTGPAATGWWPVVCRFLLTAQL